MTELLYTLQTNPYISMFMGFILFMFICLLVTMVVITFIKTNPDIYLIGMLTTMSIAIMSLIASLVVTYCQNNAVEKKEAVLTKIGNTIEVKSHSKWLKNAHLEIVGENEIHYYVKNEGQVFEIDKSEVFKND